MASLRKYLDKIKPKFEPGGKLHALRSVYDGFETFLYTPRTTSPISGAVHIHDSIDSKRTMIIVVLALLPCLFFGMYNTGYQHWLALGDNDFPFWSLLCYGFLTVLPRLLVSYIVGLGIEFISAQIKGEEIQEGYLVTGILIPLICPAELPLWMLAIAVAFAVIFAKEVFGGTGYNIWNVALVARAFLFFAYPAQMSGDKVYVATDAPFGFGEPLSDAFTGATPLGQIATQQGPNINMSGIDGHLIDTWQSFIGLIPGSFGETSMLCILIGALILLAAGVASWRVMLSVFVGGLFMSWIANIFATPLYPVSYVNPLDQIMLGGFAFAAVFMATDPVTGARTKVGKYIYGLLIGMLAIVIRIYNNGYPEGAMLAVLLMNCFAPLIDYCVVHANMRRRTRRLSAKSSSHE
ncbi:MAG: NADH:ubiquinone reductase (Na(+)-transporting) subunit B [Muribaculaceae bacterium]|nr:NADH:ubiquinone reductase (Na(+)-transporting) subunit B [Muribaculaceae bacterium]